MIEVTAGAVTRLVLDNPPLNLVTGEMMERLDAALDDITRDDDVRAVVVTGAGARAFCAGSDVKEFESLAGRVAAGKLLYEKYVYRKLAELPVPTIAAIEGDALGGGLELALCADFRVAGESAKVGQPEIQLGVIPGAGGTQRLVRLVGPAKAKDLVFTGRHVGAEEALEIGLADADVPDEEVYSTAVAMAAKFAAGPPLALAAAKQAIDEGLDLPLARGLELETRLFAGLFDTEDQKAGMRSFLENGPGKATFTGR
jgi:enoyl-CoA hydratase/carnithine racemase